VSDDNFLSRWSKRKLASKAASTAGPDRPTADAVPATAGTQSEAPAVPAQAGTEPLPPVESLTPESDFAPFMKSDVDPGLRRAALKTLFKDPRFNVMDMMDTYVDDYSKPDPLPPGWLEKIAAVTRLGDYRPPEPAEEPVDGPAGALAGASPQVGKTEPEQPVAQLPLDTSVTPASPSESKES
jgi:hypothetical protein